MPTKVAGMGESLSGGQGARWQKEAPGTSSARHHDKKGFRERERRQAHLYRAGRRPSTRGPHVLGILTRQPAVTLEQFQGLAGGSQLLG